MARSLPIHQYLRQIVVVLTLSVIALMAVLHVEPGRQIADVSPNVAFGDLNGDGYVDSQDFAIMSINWGRTDATSEEGDINEDGIVDSQDYAIIAIHWHQYVPESSSSSSSESSSSSSEESVSSSSASSSAESSSAQSSSTAPVSEPPFRGTGNAPENPPQPLFRGKGLREHAAVLDLVLQRYGLHENTPYTYAFIHEDIHPAAFETDAAETDWNLRAHDACCSMYRYLKRLRELRPSLDPGYVDWLSAQVARALNQDPIEIKAALLGFPHNHAHTNAFIRGITEQGCTTNPYVVGQVLEQPMVRPDDSEEHYHEDGFPDFTSSLDISSPFTIEQVPADDAIVYTVKNNDDVFTHYGPTSNEEMHTVIIRDDLRYYHHIHAERDADGFWRIPFDPPSAGTYWIYADFIDSDGKLHILRFERTYEGNPGEYGFQKDLRRTKSVGRKSVELQVTKYDSGTFLTLHIRDSYGNAPFLEQFREYIGHGTLVSPTGEYIHIHPSPAGDELTFHIPQTHSDFYRFFIEVKIQGELNTVEFDWEP